MMTRFLILGVVFSAAAFAEDAPRAVQVAEAPRDAPLLGADWVVSRSNQFRITGGDSLLRGTVAVLAEETKDELLKLTGEIDEWKLPVTIRLHGKPGDPLPARTVSMRLLLVDGVAELQIDTHLSRGIERDRFKRAVTAALLYERTLKKRPGGDPDARLLVPAWLSDGLLEATAWRLNQSDRRLYEALFKRGGLFKISDLFGVSENVFENQDAATRAAFRVSSGALVMALLEQPQGRDGFRAFLTEVAAFEGEMPALLRKHFPELNLSETSLEKWWVLQLANKGLNPLTETLSIQQTETALAESLILNFRTAEGIVQQKDLAAWPELAELEEPERIAAVRFAEDGLVRLSYRCFPSYRPILEEYQLILTAIAKNKTKDLPARLAKLDEVRASRLAMALHARDYLDWFEITRARGTFDDYMRLKEGLKANPHRRKDPVSDYLDRMDKKFHREEPKGLFGPQP
jgi:hypothetical protein